MLEVRALGPLEVWADGVSLPLGTPKQQAVLAMLAVRPGRVVGLEELVDELWPEAPPASAVANTRSYIRPDQVDLTAFATECHQAREALARQDVEQRAELHLGSARPRPAITLLRDHLQTHPLRERGHALLVRAGG